MRSPSRWKPVALQEVQQYIGVFKNWTLCGGYSLDLILCRQTRAHADIDIGVFRSEILDCLHSIGREQVFLCNPPRTQTAWDGTAVEAAVHDIWISDPQREAWLFQIMVFDDEGERVFYRRDRRIFWTKDNHALEIGGVRVLNPFVTFSIRPTNPKSRKRKSWTS